MQTSLSKLMALLPVLLLPILAHSQESSIRRQYLVKPVTWSDITFDIASKELKEDEGKLEYEQRWVKFAILEDSEVLVSTSIHGVARARLAAALFTQVEWKYDGSRLRGRVPDGLAKALGESDSISESIRGSFGKGLPVSVEAGVGFSFPGMPQEGYMSISPSPRETATDLPGSYTTPSSEEVKARRPARPSFGPGHEVVPVVWDGEYDKPEEYAKVSEIVASFVSVEREKAEAAARTMLPVILGNLGHELLALDLNSAEFGRLPERVRDNLERAIELQPQQFGYASYAEFERARDSGLRLKLTPDVRVMLPFKSQPSGATVTYAIPIKIKP